jgi:hypothetical protein
MASGRTVEGQSYLARKPFRRHTIHRFPAHGLTATIRHSVDEPAQVLTENVVWRAGGRRHQDPESRLCLLFPLELTQFLEAAGFDAIKILGEFRRGAVDLAGRRMIALARRA